VGDLGRADLSVVKTGVDILEIQRLEYIIQQHGERFLSRIYTPQELAEVGSKTASLAARFAAKEAVSKALGTGIGWIGWHEIEILYGQYHEPVLCLQGNAKRIAEEMGLSDWSISLSHSHDYAIAVVVAIGAG
jgi:holo-[acyl-carrier protein] synthase